MHRKNVTNHLANEQTHLLGFFEEIHKQKRSFLFWAKVSVHKPKTMTYVMEIGWAMLAAEPPAYAQVRAAPAHWDPSFPANIIQPIIRCAVRSLINSLSVCNRNIIRDPLPIVYLQAALLR